MHRFFFTTKDAFISSGSNELTGDDFKEKNTGQDEILELKKVFFNRNFHYRSTQSIFLLNTKYWANYNKISFSC